MKSETTTLRNSPAIFSRAIQVALAVCTRLTFDHVYVVGPVSDCQCDGFLIPLHQVYHHGLLLGGDPAADDSAALTGQVNKVLLPLFFSSFQPPFALRPNSSFFFCPWELQLQNVTCLGLFLEKNFILWNQRGKELHVAFSFLYLGYHSQDFADAKDHSWVISLSVKHIYYKNLENTKMYKKENLKYPFTDKPGVITATNLP